GTATFSGYTATFSVTVTDDSVPEELEFFDVNLSSTRFGFALATAAVLLADNDTPAITAISTDSGASVYDFLTTDQALTLSGTGPASSTITLYRPGSATALGTTTASGGGAWSFVYATTLAEGVYAFYATATASGHTSGASATALAQ